MLPIEMCKFEGFSEEIGNFSSLENKLTKKF